MVRKGGGACHIGHILCIRESRGSVLAWPLHLESGKSSVTGCGSAESSPVHSEAVRDFDDSIGALNGLCNKDG